MASDGEITCTNDPNFAVIYSFLKVFGNLYSLQVPTISKLQELIENTQEVLEPLKELHLRLLRRALKTVQSNRWEKGLIKFCHQQAHHQEAWEIERFSYKKASTQVKLKVLKLLLEYQFTCHPKFKNAVNNLSCKDLRLDPIGRDKNGCVYWLQVDHEADLCLYKEDQDEETWQLIARNREEFVKVITQLKNGEEVSLSVANNINSEDSSGNEALQQNEVLETEKDEENEEEFLSPESESEHESDNQNDKQKDSENSEAIISTEVSNKDNNDANNEVKDEESKEMEKDIEANDKNDAAVEITEKSSDEIPKNSESLQPDTNEELKQSEEDQPVEKIDPQDDTVSEAIEEPVMIVTGEGAGAECESSYFFGEEISEPVMLIYGDGWGCDNDTGNPEVAEKSHSEEKSDEENPPEECNGEHNEVSNSSNKKNAKLKSVTKRSLKKQSTDNAEVLNSDSKKHCMRESENSNGSPTNAVNNDSDKKESSVNDSSAVEDIVNKTTKKKVKGKVKKKHILRKGIKQKEKLSSVSEAENVQNGKTSIIEKRKSSLSSEHDEGDCNTDNEKDKTIEGELKADDPLPSKKIRLEPTPDLDNVSHSKETDTLDNKIDVSNDNIENKDLNVDETYDSIAHRKKIKAKKGKLKSKKFLQKVKNDASKSNDKVNDVKKKSKALKRSLLNATLSDKNKSESQSESEEDEPLSSGKRLKIKPKKIITSTRKKVEAKLMAKSSSESEEETLYSLAGKKTAKKLKKKVRNDKQNVKSEKVDDDLAPVRQSRRIAQMKIKEEADRRHLEEVTLRELKMIHKKKGKDDEEEWRASGSSSEGERVSRRPRKWRPSDSSPPDNDSDSEPLFEHEEPELDFNKSDHEFSPESDLETDSQDEPVRQARTLQEGSEEGFCKRCGSGEQPEWILLCDECDAGYHASCLKPMLFLVPSGRWYCPPCDHNLLISALEKELVKYDELLVNVEAERERKLQEEPEKEEEKVVPEETKTQSEEKSEDDSDGSSSWSSSSGAVYRLRARKQLPVSERAKEYDRLISSAIKEEYVEPTTSAGNQGRGKDISTIMEAAEEEKLKAEREAIEQGKPVEAKKAKRKQRRKARKLNSLEVPSEDDDETDEDFKDTGMDSSSSEISSSAERDSSSSAGSMCVRARRPHRPDHKDRKKLVESSPEVKKKKKGVFEESSSESAGAKEWNKKPKDHSKTHSKRHKKRSRSRLAQYDAAGNVIRARVTYGGLSDGQNDWSPKHRTRQKKIDYTEMPNTESEDEMHKSSGKHMPDSSDEFKVDESELSSGSECERARAERAAEEQSSDEKRRAISELIRKTAVVPLEKLPDDVTKAKTEALQAHLDAQAARQARPTRGRGSRGGRGRGGRGRGRGASGGGGAERAQGSSPNTDDALAKLVGVKIKDLRPDSTPLRPNQLEREKKRQEREAKQAEKEARRTERLQKKEEKEKLKEQKAKEREEKKLAKLALQESKRLKREKPEFAGQPGYPGAGLAGAPPEQYGRPEQRPPGVFAPGPAFDRYPHGQPPRLQVRPELRGVVGERRADQLALREGTLSVAGSPQPFAPMPEEPSVITRMPHVLNHYRGQMMYPPGGSGYGPRGQGVMYQLHPGLGHQGRPSYPQYYYPRGPPVTSSHGPHGPPGPSATPPHGPPVSSPHGPNPSPHGHNPSPHGPIPSPHGPIQSPHGPIPSPHGPIPSPHGPIQSPHGPIPSPHGPMQSPHGPMPSPHGPMPSHGPPVSSPHHPSYRPGSFPLRPGSRPDSHGHSVPFPHGMSPGPGMSHGQNAPHGPPQGPANMSHGPPVSSPHGPPGLPHGPNMSHIHPSSSPHGQLTMRGPSPGLLQGVRPSGPIPNPAIPRPSETVSPSRQNSPDNVPIKIKAEVKTEPEYQSPPGSPSQRPISPELPRNRIKRTENKDGRRPLGPYAPQYGPYGPYAPPTSAPENLQARLQHPLRMPNMAGYLEPKPSPSQSPLQERMPFDPNLRPDRSMIPEGPRPARPLHEMIRPPAPDKHIQIRPPLDRMHEMNRPSESSILHDMIRAPIRPIMHDMLRPPVDRPNSMPDTNRLPTPDRQIPRPPGSERNVQDMRYDRPIMPEMRPGDRMHDILRADKNIHEMPRYPDRNLIRDMSRPPPDVLRPAGPDRLMPPGHEMPPHYPYMRPQMRPYMPLTRPPQPASPGMSPFAQYGDMNRMDKPAQMPRESVLMRKPSPKPDEAPPEVGESESPGEEEPPSPPERKPEIPKVDENKEVAMRLSNIKEEREEGSVFGGLVSYFSSQREDDLDA